MSSRGQPDHSLGPGLAREPRVTGHSGKHASPHRASTRLEKARAQLRSLLPPGAGLITAQGVVARPTRDTEKPSTRGSAIGHIAHDMPRWARLFSMPLTQVAGLLVGTSALATPGADRNLADLALRTHLSARRGNGSSQVRRSPIGAHQVAAYAMCRTLDGLQRRDPVCAPRQVSDRAARVKGAA